MTKATVIELLPLPEPNGSYTNPYDGDDLENYARANVAHATAVKDAEIERLRAEVERLKSMTAVTMGVGRGDGSLFVHGDYESIKAAQDIVLRAEQLAEALRECRPFVAYAYDQGIVGADLAGLNLDAALHPTAALLDHDKEGE